MRLFKTLILIFITANLYGQSSVTKLSEWRTYPIPKSDKTLYKYNSDTSNWYVFLDSNQLHVGNKSDYYGKQPLPFIISPVLGEERIFQGRRSVIQVDDGFLVGFFRGEWGGNLYWFSKDGNQKYKIADCMIVQFIKQGNKIFAIEGLSHMFSSRGSIIEIVKKGNKWVSDDYLPLPAAPKAIQIDSRNNFIVVTSSSLVSIDSNKSISTLIKKGIWENYLYPTSSVIQNNALYIGMRKGVFKYNIVTKEEEWLLPY